MNIQMLRRVKSAKSADDDAELHALAEHTPQDDRVFRELGLLYLNEKREPREPFQPALPTPKTPS